MQAQAVKQNIHARRMVASYPDYASAQAAVDYLADRKYPVEHVTISAEGIRLVERITGRYGWAQAALNRALSGAVAGALFGAVFGALSLIFPVATALELALWGGLYGAVIGLLVGVVMHAAFGGTRSFSSQAAVQAEPSVTSCSSTKASLTRHSRCFTGETIRPPWRADPTWTRTT